MDFQPNLSAEDPKYKAALQAYYNSRYQEMVQNYVGPGKRFADEKQFRDYVGGVGQGASQYFGGGIVGDQDKVLRNWALAGQLGNGALNTLGAQYNPLADKDFAAFAQNFDPATGQSKAPGAGGMTYEQWRDQVMGRLDKFSQDMGKPLDQLLKEGDLGATSAYTTGANQAATGAYGRGVGGGGLSTMNTQRAALDAGMGYQQNRQAMGLQATNGLLGSLQGQIGNDQQINLQLQNAQANAEAYDANRKAQQWQAAGSILGGVVGGATSYAGGGSFGSGFNTGSSIGGGLGGLAGGAGYTPYQYHTPSTPVGGGGLAGTTRFQGAQ